jgi:hypothetical protein
VKAFIIEKAFARWVTNVFATKGRKTPVHYCRHQSWPHCGRKKKEPAPFVQAEIQKSSVGYPCVNNGGKALKNIPEGLIAP